MANPFEVGDIVAHELEKYRYHYVVTRITDRLVHVRQGDTGELLPGVPPGTDIGHFEPQYFKLILRRGVLSSKEDMEALYG